MSGEWSEHPFPEVIDFQEGPGILAKDFRAKGVPLIRLSGLEYGSSVLAGCNYLDPEMVSQRWSHFRLREGDTLLSTSASLGRTAIVTADAIGAIPYTGIIRMRPRDERVFAPFIRYLLQGKEFQAQAEMMGVGSVIRHFGPFHLRQMKVILPPLPEQWAIAHILGTLDDKIELNRCMNQTLESMAQAIFKSWFVDFGPVRAKADGRDAGLSLDLADLFPARLVESDLREIPLGWKISTVGSSFTLTMGQSPPGHTYNKVGDGLPFYQGRVDFGFRYPIQRVFCSAATRLAESGDTLVSVRAPVGDINMAIEQCAIGRGIAALRHKSGDRSFTYYAVRSLAGHLQRFDAEGTIFGSINRGDFERLQVVLPPEDLVRAFGRMVSPFDDQIETSEKESRTFAELRDALLPKLISGEIRVLPG